MTARLPHLPVEARQVERVTGVEDAHLYFGGQRVGELGEGVGRLPHHVGQQRSQPGREVGAPVDGDGQRGVQQLQRLRRPIGVHVPRPQRRPPTPDGQQGHVDLAADGRHAVEQVGVAGEIDVAAAADDVAEAFGFGPPGQRPRRVVGGRGFDGDAADGRRLARSDLHDVAVAVQGQEARGPARGDDEVFLAQPAHRAQMQVVGVEMGEENRVQATGVDVGGGGGAQQVADARGEQRVGQQADAVHLDEYRCVTDVRDPVHTVNYDKQAGWEQWIEKTLILMAGIRSSPKDGECSAYRYRRTRRQ